MTALKFDSKGFLFNEMTVKVANDFMDFADRKGRRSASVANELTRAAEQLLTGNLQWNTGKLESLLSSSWTDELAHMQREFNMLENLLWNAVLFDDNVGMDEKSAACSMVVAQVEAAFESARG